MNVLLKKSVASEYLEGARASQKNLLLVDDDPAIRQILGRVLAEENYCVQTAANGLEAIELVNASTDLVLLDLNMPLKDGWDAFAGISSKNPWLPIILITGRPNQYFPALAAGVGALLEKPLDFAMFFDTIRSLLEETVDERRARMTGHPLVFIYTPPQTVSLVGNHKIAGRNQPDMRDAHIPR